MHRHGLNILFLLCIILPQLLQAKKSDDTIFFKIIEQKVRLDYQNCTGDYSALPLRKLMVWKESIDSVVARKDYPRILQSFFEDTSNSNSRSLPCDVVAWYHKTIIDKQIQDSLSKAASKDAVKKTSDSLTLAHELAAVKRTPLDLLDIPFGVSHMAVLKLLSGRGINEFVDDNSVVYYTDSVSQTFFVRAFFFNRSGTYYKFETESRSVKPDSLDMVIRPLLQNMETMYRELTASQPSETNYIGFNDITQGKLTISKVWNIKGIKIVTGMSMYNNLFYAKSIVISEL
jgi:hypothetical protein